MTKFGSLYSGILAAQAPLFALQKSWPRRWLLGILRRRSHLPKERRRWLLGAPTVARSVLFSAATARFPTERSLVATVGPQ